MSVTNLKNSESNLKFKKDFLYNYLLEAPVALAVERACECEILAEYEFKTPVLDIGCGEGVFAHILFDQQIDCGIDPDADEIERAKHYHMYKELIPCYGNAIPKDNGAFNTIFSNSVLEHIEDLEPVLKEARRLLADHGNFYVTIPTDKFDHYTWINQLLTGLRLNKWAANYRRSFNKFWNHYHYYNREEWAKLFNKAGFDVVASRDYMPLSLCLFNESFIPLAFPAFVVKRLTGRWFISKSFRKLYVKSLFSIAQTFINKSKQQKDGGIIFFHLVKKG